MAYWMWGNLGALALCAGPLVGAGLAMLRRGQRPASVAPAGRCRRHRSRARRRLRDEPVRGGADLAAVRAVADRLGGLLPERWRRWGLGLQVACALAVQHLLYTSW